MNIPDSFQTDALLIISSFFLIFLSFFFLFCLGSMLSLISDLPELTVWHAMLNVVEVRSEECQHKASKIVKTQYSGHTNNTIFVVYRKRLWYFRLYILHRHKYLLLYLFHNISAECYFVDRFTVTDAIHVNCCYCCYCRGRSYHICLLHWCAPISLEYRMKIAPVRKSSYMVVVLIVGSVPSTHSLASSLQRRGQWHPHHIHKYRSVINIMCFLTLR